MEKETPRHSVEWELYGWFDTTKQGAEWKNNALVAVSSMRRPASAQLTYSPELWIPIRVKKCVQEWYQRLLNALTCRPSLDFQIIGHYKKCNSECYHENLINTNVVWPNPNPQHIPRHTQEEGKKTCRTSVSKSFHINILGFKIPCLCVSALTQKNAYRNTSGNAKGWNLTIYTNAWLEP